MALAPRVAVTRSGDRPAAVGVIWFVVLTYLIAWAWCLPLVIGGATVEQGRGWPTHVPALLAPALATVLVVGSTQGLPGIGHLVRHVVRRRFSPVWWLVALSPLVVLVLTLLGTRLSGLEPPDPGGFARFGGLPASGVVTTFLLVLVLNGFGEEIGWRGFLQDRLQQRFDPLPATLIVAATWAVWHTPFFFVLATYSGFDARTLVVFPLGLTSGAVVLTWLYNNTGGSILGAALWHASYNMAVATAGATDLIQGVVTGAVMLAAAILIGAEIIVRRRGGRSVLGGSFREPSSGTRPGS